MIYNKSYYLKMKLKLKSLDCNFVGILRKIYLLGVTGAFSDDIPEESLRGVVGLMLFTSTFLV